MSEPRDAFVPPHCPISDCPFHASRPDWRWSRHGFFSREAAPHRVQRFRCGHCGHTFSEQTFRTTYWLKRPDALEPVAFRLLTCSGYRQIVREAGCSPSTVERHAERLGRHALLLLEAFRPPEPIREPLVIDGFESFAWSQYFPLHLHLVVGAESHFVYAFTHSLLRRKGRMTERQKRRRASLEARHGRPDPRALEHGMAAALRLAVRSPQALTVRSDEHDAYPRALRRLPGCTLVHERTSSREARTPGNPLFPVNRLDLLLRHNGAHHKRETIAFAKRHQAVIWRAAWFLAWLNLSKEFSERRRGGTPAMRVGLTDRPLPVSELLRWRHFPSRIRPPEPWAGYYRGEVRTPPIRNESSHRLRLAW